MNTVEQEKILAAVRSLCTEEAALTEALGRVLAEDVVARKAVPPWDNTAMDASPAVSVYL